MKFSREIRKEITKVAAFFGLATILCYGARQIPPEKNLVSSVPFCKEGKPYWTLVYNLRAFFHAETVTEIQPITADTIFQYPEQFTRLSDGYIIVNSIPSDINGNIIYISPHNECTE